MKATTMDSSGYPMIYDRTHPRSWPNGYIHEHIVIVETALGFPLIPPHEVHHFDKVRSNNANTNLVVCEDRSYHLLLHARQRIVAAGGNPDTQKICKQCKSLKFRTEFNYSRTRGDGLDNKCKQCDHNRPGSRKST